MILTWQRYSVSLFLSFIYIIWFTKGNTQRCDSFSYESWTPECKRPWLLLRRDGYDSKNKCIICTPRNIIWLCRKLLWIMILTTHCLCQCMVQSLILNLKLGWQFCIFFSSSFLSVINLNFKTIRSCYIPVLFFTFFACLFYLFFI